MTLDRTESQTSAEAEPTPANRGEAPKRRRGDEVRAAGNDDERSGREDLLTEVLARDNMRAACGRGAARLVLTAPYPDFGGAIPEHCEGRIPVRRSPATKNSSHPQP